MSQFKYEWHKKFTESGLKPLTKLVGYAAWDESSRDGDSIHPGLPRLAERTGLSVMTVRRHLEVLRDTGWLVRTMEAKKSGNRKFADEYQLAYPAEAVIPQSRPVFSQENTNTAGLVFPQENTDWDEPVFSQENSGAVENYKTSVLSDTEPVFSQNEPLFSQENSHQGINTKGLHHLESEDSSAAPLRSADAARSKPTIQPPLMQGVPRPQESLGFGQPRLFLEAKLGRGLHHVEENLAAAMHAKGKPRDVILKSIQSLRISA